jgi:hypothetical protein
MKLFNNKQDEPKLSPQSVALVNEIKGIIDKQDSDKNLFFAVRFNQNYRDDYLTIRDKLPALVGDDGSYYGIKLMDDKKIERYIGFWEKDNETPELKNRSVCVYLTQNEDEIDSLRTAISGKNEFFTIGEFVSKTNEK